VYLLGHRFERIDWETLQRAKDERIEESRTLDFKEALPDIESKESKREFLEDVCALANTAGGLLLYGVKEARDENSKLGHIAEIPGIAPDAIPADLKSRIQELVRSSFDPRFSGVEIDWIDLPDDGNRVLKVGVERSPRAPHRVTSNGSREFMFRSMTSSEKMDAEQVTDSVRRSLLAARSAFDRIQALASDAAKSRVTEFATLWGGAVPIFSTGLPQPVGSPIVSSALSKLRDSHQEGGLRVRYDHLGAALAMSVDPFMVMERVHRDGTVERFDFIPIIQDRRNEAVFYLNHLRLRDALGKLKEVIVNLRSDVGITGPVIATVGLFGASGTVLQQVYAPTQSGGTRLFDGLPKPVTSGTLLLEPEETTDEFFGRVVKRAADLFWNSGGHPFCAGIDDEGNRSPGLP